LETREQQKRRPQGLPDPHFRRSLPRESNLALPMQSRCRDNIHRRCDRPGWPGFDSKLDGPAFRWMALPSDGPAFPDDTSTHQWRFACHVIKEF
jgi:hypothetical protein